jgi:hypothetical protein
MHGRRKDLDDHNLSPRADGQARDPRACLMGGPKGACRGSTRGRPYTSKGVRVRSGDRLDRVSVNERPGAWSVAFVIVVLLVVLVALVILGRGGSSNWFA